MTPDLFVGVVTHEHSRFGDAVKPEGLMARIAKEAAAAGATVATGVCALDEYSEELLRISPAVVRDSIRAELDSELRWRYYLSGRSAGAGLRAFMAARRAYRTVRLAPTWRASVTSDGARMVRRLVNIELSHLRLIGEAVASRARWALLLEDDAGCDDPGRFTAELLSFVAGADKRGKPLTANMSESFSVDDLGIRHLLVPVAPAESGPWTMFASQRPVTNTVCAVLYRNDFLVQLQEQLRAIPLAPVIPIDFKLNEAFMRMAPRMAPGDVWVAAPAPLKQRSGVPVVRV